MASKTTVREYKSEGAMKHGIAHMARAGWRVTSQASYRPRKGIMRTILGGFLFFNKKPRFTVTFARDN